MRIEMARLRDPKRTKSAQRMQVRPPPLLLVIELGLILLGFGCRSNRYEGTKVHRLGTRDNKGEAFMVDLDSSRRGVYVLRSADGTLRVAAEPPPDTALSLTLNRLFSATGAATNPVGVGGSGGILYSNAVVESVLDLSKRTQATIIMRDAMFRLAEMYLNGAIDKLDYQRLYSIALWGAVSLSATTNMPAFDVIAQGFAGENSAKRSFVESQASALEALSAKVRFAANGSKEELADALLSWMRIVTEGNIEFSAPKPQYQISGRYVIVEPLRFGSEMRLSNGFTPEWSGEKQFVPLLINAGVPKQPALLELVQETDGARERSLLFSDQLISLNGQTSYYLTSMDRRWAREVLWQYPSAAVLFIEKGLTLDEVKKTLIPQSFRQ